MKLMINIPDEAYELLKSKSELDNIAESIIANGTPVSNEGDSISRSALIKWIDESVSQYGNTYSTDMLNMWGLFKDYLINNAPTVEPKYYERVIAQINPVIDERPQGEWTHHEEYTNNRTFYITECPFCKLRVQEETNFCPNCGADMQKGGAE